ncbi:MAG: tRNA threonylcarbamoyladenosine dehydratase [Clostridia bacterium]|nr:tRNA threonylcarbamoyladenosine dehydratase [Clostridia bacterium]
MENIYDRTALLIGKENLNKLKNSRVAVFGIGGVGGYAVEALARSGIGTIDLFDNDTVSVTNINRQIIATNKTIGLDKVVAAAQRISEINAEIKVNCHNIFFSAETDIDFTDYDYIIDAIDTVTSKIELIVKAKENNIPIISSMGTGNKLNADMLEIADIYKTSVCPLARVMRYELKKRGIKSLKVVYSKEEPIKPKIQTKEFGRHIPASIAFVPAVSGMLLAGEVIKDIINNN